MNEKSFVPCNFWGELFSNLTSGDKGFIALLIAMVGAYGLKRHCDNVDKGMDLGYSSGLKIEGVGEMQFYRQTEDGSCTFSEEKLDDTSENDPNESGGVEDGPGGETMGQETPGAGSNLCEDLRGRPSPPFA